MDIEDMKDSLKIVDLYFIKNKIINYTHTLDIVRNIISLLKKHSDEERYEKIALYLNSLETMSLDLSRIKLFGITLNVKLLCYGCITMQEFLTNLHKDTECINL
jgi:hypothetical protein